MGENGTPQARSEDGTPRIDPAAAGSALARTRHGPAPAAACARRRGPADPAE